MIRQLLKDRGIEMTDMEFIVVMKETENDVIQNHLRLGIRSNLDYILRIAIIFYGIMKRIQI